MRKLRDYEERHRRCGPHTQGYNKTLQLLHGDLAARAAHQKNECKYVLYSPYSGLGNRIVSLTSSFLYALLTGRVLLIDRGKDFSKLFCEPFPNTSWLIPLDFPIKNFEFDSGHPLSYASLVKNHKSTIRDMPSFVYAHLVSDYGPEDARFFFEEDQRALKAVPWLLIRSEVYFSPAFFLNEDFEPELARMFPDTEAVFHHLVRYLFQPSNKVWGIITRYYKAYLAVGEETLSIQIRNFEHVISPFEIVARQMISCTIREKLLPEVELGEAQVGHRRWKIKNVLVTALYSGYADKIRRVYWDHPTRGGVILSVHQPSHEEKQLLDDEDHDIRAWAEMNLLSFSDVLVTSAWSTFGYVGQGLGGLKPWVMLRLKSHALPDPSCLRDISMEPCFHKPPEYLLEKKMAGNRGKVAHYVNYCLDAEGGLKILDRNSTIFKS